MKGWQNLSILEIYRKLKSSEFGLTEVDAQDRLKKDGLNELPKNKKDGFFKILVSQLVNPIIILLIIAALISFFADEKIDAIAITFIIIIDAVLGTLHELKAEENCESLKNLIKVKGKVKREDNIYELDSSEIVMGDIVILESGSKVTADLRIIECNNLTVDESILTGESISVTKNNVVTKDSDKSNMLFAGTSVVTGRASCIVVGTALNTEIGSIALKVISTKDAKSPLSIRMERFSKQISILVIIVAVIVAVVLITKNYSGAEVFLSVVALSVSAMPEGLSLALTMALTIASNRMAKKNVIVKKLNSVESLGSCTVIASDKTGTLTVNEQTAKKILLPNEDEFIIEGTGYNNEGKIQGVNIKEAEHISKLGIINNEAFLSKEKGEWKKYGDSIDIAFLALGYKLKLDNIEFETKEEIPYESQNKYSAVFYEENGKTLCTAKGSPEVILNFCSSMLYGKKEVKIDKKKLMIQNELLASEGYRVIAICEKKKDIKNYNEKDLKQMTFVGLVAFMDPIRKEVIESINECKKAGIKVVMITGDHALTALSIAKEIGIAGSDKEVTSGEEIDKYYKKGEKKFDEFIKSKTVFARVTPLEKLEIVESFKRQGEYIAVTGDGVNDAPAIKAANIGIAMGSGTDVAKETANMIIIDDNFNTIVTGVKEGRNAYLNIRKVSNMLLSCGVAEVLFFILSIVFNLPIPLVAIQLLWLNLVTDGLQDFALSFERETDTVMNERPRSPKENLFEKKLIKQILLGGISIGLIVFMVWLILLKVLHFEDSIARGYIMVLMVFMQNMHVLNCRSEIKSVFENSFRKNPFILVTIVSAIVLQIIVMEVDVLSKFLQTTPIPFSHLLMLFLASVPIIFIFEIYKYSKNTKKTTN